MSSIFRDQIGTRGKGGKKRQLEASEAREADRKRKTSH
jgi:hypothetical protein